MKDFGSDGGTRNEGPLLVDYFLVLLKRKAVILLFVFASAAGSGLYAFLLPDVYTAKVRILTTPVDTSATGLRHQMERDLVFGPIGGPLPTDLYKGILESRTLTDRLIDRFSLQGHYGEQFRDTTRKRLHKSTRIETENGPLITVSVEDEDPRTAAHLANGYAEELDRINRSVNITEGHLKRMFLEKRLQRVKDELLDAEGRLKGFQERHGLVALEEQARETIEGAARIKGEIVAAQTELEVFKKFGTARNKEAIQLESRIAELTSQLLQIETGMNGATPSHMRDPDGKTGGNFYIPFSALPSLGVQLARLTREAKIQEEVFKLIVSQYELAKIEEAKDINTIQILDSAVAPERKSGPGRFLIVALAAAAGLFLGMAAAFSWEFMARLKDEDPERYRLFLLYAVHRSR
jgi:uncharacterized protein involved in exopolysaccharide biosynthesis